MEISADILNEIYEKSGLFFSAEEIAIMLDLDIDDFKKEMRNKKSEVFKAYSKGKLESISLVRANIKELVVAGSLGADAQFINFKRDQDISETEL